MGLHNASLATEKRPLRCTLEYAAPEIIRAQGKGITETVPDTAIDMWSLGIIAHEVLTGSLSLDDCLVQMVYLCREEVL